MHYRVAIRNVPVQQEQRTVTGWIAEASVRDLVSCSNKRMLELLLDSRMLLGHEGR